MSDNGVINSSEKTRRKLIPVKETFYLDDGEYTGIVSEAFFYTEDKIMLKIELYDKTIFLVVATIDKIENYPFNKLLSQADVEYIEELVNLKVAFTIKNSTVKNGETYSNVRKICLDE